MVQVPAEPPARSGRTSDVTRRKVLLGLGAAGVAAAVLHLGRYRLAFKAYDHMALLAPGIASYTRVANARELLGRPTGAAEADELALQTDSTVPEHVAWTLVQFGNVHFNMGEIDQAERPTGRRSCASPVTCTPR